MKIVFLTTVPQSLRFLSGHIRFLQSQEADVAIISSPAPSLDSFAEEHSVEAIGIDMPRRISPLRDLISLWHLARRLREIQPDIVHAHTPKAGLLGMLAAAIIRVPIRLYHIHGLPLLTAGKLQRIVLKLCDMIACRLAHQVYCVSNSIRQAAVHERICPAAKLMVLENGTIDGIDAEVQFTPGRFETTALADRRRSLGIPAGAPVIGFVGRIVEDKGIYDLLAAFARLSEDIAELHLLIVGTGEGERQISAAAMNTLKHGPRIHLVGFEDDPAIYYAIMNVLAVPTYREGFGLVAAEAAAMEVPVVATRIPGCVDAVADGVTGTLVPARDATALAAALKQYLDSADLSRRHGVAGRVRVLRDFQPLRIRRALWQQYLMWMNARLRPVGELETSRQAAHAA